MDRAESTDVVSDNISVADWYDGLVVATGSHPEKSYVIVMVAWDMERSLKAFLLLDIERSVEAEVKRCIQVGSWNEPCGREKVRYRFEIH